MSITNGEVLDFTDYAPAQIKVKYNGKTYILLEASEEAVCSWKNKEAKRAKFSSSGEILGMESPADTEVNLLAHCLYYTTPEETLPVDKDGLPDPKFLVPASRIKLLFQSKVVRKLSLRLREVSDLLPREEPEELEKQIKELTEKLNKTREEDERRKNSSAALPVTSD